MFRVNGVARRVVARLQPLNRGLKCLVVAEHDKAAVTGGTLAAVTAATKACGDDVEMLLTGDGAKEVAQATSVAGVQKVLVANEASVSTEGLAALATKEGYTHVMAGVSTTAKSFLPRLAAALDVSPVTDIIEVLDATTFRRPMYAGNAVATVKSAPGAVAVATVRTTAFEKAVTTTEAPVIEAVDLPADPLAPTFVSSTSGSSSAKKVDLVSAKTVVSGGRGMKSGENFQLLDKLADAFGSDTAAVGASRAAVDAGMVPNELQVGQTGKVVAPELYVAVGISGAIQHLAGMKDSKIIVAVNKDDEAPIFKVADYGLVGDLFDVVPQLTDALRK